MEKIVLILFCIGNLGSAFSPIYKKKTMRYAHLWISGVCFGMFLYLFKV